jgi:hypothetical protein
VVVVVIVLAVIAVVLLLPNLDRLTGGTNPSGTSTASAQSTSTQPPTAAELAQAVTDYYALLPDNTDAGWALLTPSYQRQTGGRDSYDSFWNDIDTVTATAASGTTPDKAQATITYVAKSGNQKSSERRSFTLVRSDGVLKIDKSSVI